MTKVFMSHNFRDKAFVREIATQLKQHSIECWIDEAEIKIGDSLSDKIGEAILQQTDFFIVFLSNNSINSQWVKKELQIALEREMSSKKVIVLPILIEEVNLPPFLSDKRYADFTTLEKMERELPILLKTLVVSTDELFVPTTSQNIPVNIALAQTALGGAIVNEMLPKGENDRWLMVYFKRSSDADKDRRRLTRIHGILTSYPGDDRFTIVIEDRNQSFKMEFPKQTTDFCPELQKDLTTIVGEGNIEIYERPEW
jgi:hypothetical protein